VNLDLSDDQLALRAAVASLFAKESSPERVRAAEPLGFDVGLWERLRDVGVPGMATAAGGASLVDLAVVCGEAGAALASAPVVESFVAVGLLDRLGACPDDVATGDAIAALAPAPARDGRFPLVPAGAVAGVVVGLVGDALVMVRDEPPRSAPSNLGSSPLADRAVPADATVLARGVAAHAALGAALDDWRVLLANALTGAARTALRLGVEYASARVQFGAPIGSFQAVQQRLADVATALDGAELLALEAAWARDAEPGRSGPLAAMAFAFAAQTAHEVADASLHFHGGYGFMLEYDIQLFFRRVTAWAVALGGVRPARRRVGALLAAGESVATSPSGDDTGGLNGRLDFRLGSRAEAFRAEVRAFFAEHLTAEVSERVHTTGTIHDWGLHRALAARGWLAASWPRELDGQERDPYEMVAFDEEVARAGAPMDGWGTTELVARTLTIVGSEEQKQRVVPPALRGEFLMCLGYSEPDAGSDVASVVTRAVRDGDEWVINGQKMFTTLAHESAYVFLLTRTNPDVAKHRGLTMFLVPLDTPGVEIRAVHTLGGERTNITFYNDVRVPDSARVGEVDGGWDVLTVALAFERNPTANGEERRLLDRMVGWARDTGALDDPSTRETFGRIAAETEAGRLLAYRMAWVAARGELPIVEGSKAKLFGSESFQRASAELLELLGPAGVLRHGEPDAPLRGAVEHAFRHAVVMTIYAGSSEIQRSIIAERGLGLPRAR
jgi:alkylation response protein AidB-like acyl-CoA dehydrogenase